MTEAIEGVRGKHDEFNDARIRANIRDAVDGFDKEARKSAELAQREAQLDHPSQQLRHCLPHVHLRPVQVPILVKIVEGILSDVFS